MAVPRTKTGNYPSVLSYGFRPFFLLGSLYGGLTILFWLPLFYGQLETHSLFSPIDWHIHEMLFGYLAAVVTGFLLTAIPNWTGRLPVQGLPLLTLVVVWLLGRLAVFFSNELGWFAAAMDCSFLLMVVVAAATEIIAGKNWQNLKVLAPVTVLFAANIVFYLEVACAGTSDIGRRLGLGVVLVLLALIGGRIIPSFTRNWLVRENPGRLPVPFNRFDQVTIMLTVIALLSWVFLPEHGLTGGGLLIAAFLQGFRLYRWAGWRTLRDPLVTILHVAYVFVPIGLFLVAAAILRPDLVPSAAGMHAIGIGALGGMTLAVMTRATLGHTGRRLEADSATCVLYAAILLASVTRIAASFDPSGTILLYVSATSWAVAFLGFALWYGPMLVRPRVQIS